MTTLRAVSRAGHAYRGRTRQACRGVSTAVSERSTVTVASRRHLLLTARGGSAVVAAFTAHSRFAANSRHLASTSAAPVGQDTSLSESDIMVYQYKICPFCNKLKAVMDYFKIPYRTTEVNPLTKKELSFSKDYKKVPVVRLGGEYLKDSPEIIKTLMTKLKEEGTLTSEEYNKFCSEDANKWAEWADKSLAVLLFPNLTRSFAESYQAFAYVRDVDTFGPMDKVANQVIGATAMWMAQGKLLKKYNITDERVALTEALTLWNDRLGKQPFGGGAKPDLGDLCVFGCIKAIHGLDTHKEVLKQGRIGEWYDRMRKEVGYTGDQF